MSKKNVIKKSALTPTVLVAGGAGFIGSHLCEELLNRGARVVVLDNFNTGKEIHIDHLLSNKSFAIFNVDINKGLPQEIESVDYIFHFAGLEEYLFNKSIVSLDSLLTNSFGTKNLLDLASRSEAKFLLASSIDVYEGKMSQLDLQDYFGKTTFDENKYSMTEAKRFAEALVWEYQKKVDVDVRIVRLPEVYGPRMNLDSSGSLGGFMKELIEGRDLTIVGDGVEKEFYTYIDDAVAGIIKALFSKETRSNIYSLVPTEPYSILEIAFLVKNIADRPLEVKYIEGVKEVKPIPKKPDTFNLTQLSWEAKTNLKEGVKKTLEWFGYSLNENPFKPAILIAQKKQVENNKTDEPNLFTLGDIKVAPTSTEGAEVLKENFKKINEGFEQTVDEKKTVIKTSVIETPEVKVPRKRFSFNFGFMLKPYSLVIFGLLVPTIILYVFLPVYRFYSGARNSITSFQNISNAALKMDNQIVSSEAVNANTNVLIVRDSLSKLRWIANLFGKNEEFSALDKMMSSLESFSRAGTFTSNALKPYDSLWLVMKPDTEEVLDPQVFNEARLAISSAQNFLELSKADFKEINQDKLPEKLRNLSSKYSFYMNLGIDGLAVLDNITLNLPTMLGADTPKRYMILFQNSNEIRPTGGFIGSYGIVQFEKGKIKDLLIDDIYNPDGQIEIKDIENTPPEPIKAQLKENRLFIRNANWNPDFTESSKIIKGLYEEVTSTKIDGVIAIDLDFVKSLLDVTGPVFLTSYNEEISSENLYERTQYHSEFNYNDGSDQKKSFLTLLGSKLMEKMFSLNKENIPLLIQKLKDSVEGRHLLIYIENNPLSALMHERKWDGSLVKTQKDYLQIVNANLGGTKANYYVKNSYDYAISSKTRDGLLRADLTLNYKHTGENESWPGGPYTNYLRVLTQAGTKLTKATIKVGDLEEKDIFKDITVDNVNGYVSYEYLFTINPKEEAKIVVQYDLPQELTLTKESAAYDFYWQKQAGVSGDVFSFSFAPPFGMEVVDKSSNLGVSNDKITVSGEMSRDISGYINMR